MTLPLHSLRGRDHLLLQSLKEAGGSVEVVPCEVCLEIPSEDWSDASGRHFWIPGPSREQDGPGEGSRQVYHARIAAGVTAGGELPGWEEEEEEEEGDDDLGHTQLLPEDLHTLAGATELTRGEKTFVEETNMENDAETPLCRCWPFRGVAWVCSKADAMRHFTPENESDETWGNSSVFAIYWYKHAALLWRPEGDDAAADSRKERLPFASDVESGNGGYLFEEMVESLSALDLKSST